MVLLYIHDHTRVHRQPRLHPFLMLSFVLSILLAAPLLDVPFTVNALSCIMFHGHLLANMLKRVEWLRTPFHQPVLCHEFDPFSGMEGSSSAHAVLLRAAMSDLGILHLL